MIEIYEGTIGGGKTYSAVLRMVQHMSRGGTVFTNVDMKWDELDVTGCPAKLAQLCRVDKYAGGRGFLMQPSQMREIKEGDMARFSEVVAWGTDKLPVLCVLDEIHLWFNARDWQKVAGELLAFLTQSRKCSVDIIFITQHRDNVDKQFRRLLQYSWTFTDSERFKLPGWGSVIPNRIIANCWYRETRQHMERRWVVKDQRVFAAYQSKAIVGGGVACKNGVVDLVQVERVEKVPMVNPVWLRRTVIYLLVGVLVILKIVI